MEIVDKVALNTLSVLYITDNTTLNSNTYNCIIFTGAAGKTVTLPEAENTIQGQTIIVQNSSANNLTVQRQAPDQIVTNTGSNVTSVSIASGAAINFVSNVTYNKWYVTISSGSGGSGTWLTSANGIYTNDNVGIGADAHPTKKLYVVGDIDIDGSINVLGPGSYQLDGSPFAAQWTNSLIASGIYTTFPVIIGIVPFEFTGYPLYVYVGVLGPIRSDNNPSWDTVSDSRIKENITDADLNVCYNNVKNIKLKRYSFKNDTIKSNDNHVLGWIADDVETVFPKSVNKTKAFGYDDLRNLNVTQMYHTMYGALQKLMQKVEALEAEVAELKSKSQ